MITKGNNSKEKNVIQEVNTSHEMHKSKKEKENKTAATKTEDEKKVRQEKES